jgi:hypothetical protein
LDMVLGGGDPVNSGIAIDGVKIRRALLRPTTVT